MIKTGSKDEKVDDEVYFDSESEPLTIEKCTPDKLSIKKTSFENNQASNFDSPSSIIYYAVQFSNSELASKVESSRIFQNKENAMKLCKQDPDNRTFKVTISSILLSLDNIFQKEFHQNIF